MIVAIVPTGNAHAVKFQNYLTAKGISSEMYDKDADVN